MIENDCIVTRVGVYDEISPEPSGNPSGSALRISLGLRRYFIVYPSSRHNTVTIYYWWRNVCVHCKTPEAVLTHPSIHMKTTFADVEPNPVIVCVVGPAAVVTFPFNSLQATVCGTVLAPCGEFLAWAPCPSYNPNPNTSIVFLIGVSLAWYLVQWWVVYDILDRSLRAIKAH